MFGRNEITDPNAKPPRIAHHWSRMEEYRPNGGMWQIPKTLDRGRHIRESSDLMAEPERFADAMRLALKRWPLSCEVAFTAPGLNLRAWLGHAGCFIATGSPEETTRLGWHELDDGEQYGANAAADAVIREWRAANSERDAQPTLTFGEDDDA